MPRNSRIRRLDHTAAGRQDLPGQPPLHFWATAGLYKLFGITPFAARIPEAFAAFLGFLTAYFFGRKIFRNPSTAFLAAMILLSSYGYFFWGRRTRIDIEMAVFFSMSLVFFYCGLDTVDRKNKALWYAAFWLATGFAMMSKAFVALTNLAIIVSYCLMVVLRSNGRRIAPGWLALTSPLMLLPILPWAIPLITHERFADFMQVYNQTVIMHRGKAFFTYFLRFGGQTFSGVALFLSGCLGLFPVPQTA
ncbi:MAG: glycosyltransferase family 39 protein [Desulfobacterales bacterium]|nr:MAG: glycosyltransferase family 39 protein [Desulfobacterales bacterium]